jgi:hypothetical protein
LAFIFNAFAADPKKPDPQTPATIGTGLTLLAETRFDIGENGILHPNKVGVLARDPQGTLWESRKMSDAPDAKIAFYPQARAAEATTSRPTPDPETRYKIRVAKIDPAKAEGAVWRFGENRLTLAGPVTGSWLFEKGASIELKERGATVSDLTFPEPCDLKILEDKTLAGTRDAIAAKDATGARWASRKVRLGDQEVYAFFKDAPAAAPPDKAVSQPIPDTGSASIKKAGKERAEKLGKNPIFLVNGSLVDSAVSIKNGHVALEDQDMLINVGREKEDVFRNGNLVLEPGEWAISVDGKFTKQSGTLK